MRTCKTCQNKVKIAANQNACALFSTKTPLIVEDDDYCSWQTESAIICSICGNIIPKFQGILSYQEKIKDKYYTLCQNCSNNLYTCNTCRYINYCPFEQDRINIQPYIQKQIKQGNVTQIVNVKNPERIKATCEAKKCPCFSETGCNKNKENYSCKSYILTTRDS